MEHLNQMGVRLVMTIEQAMIVQVVILISHKQPQTMGM